MYRSDLFREPQAVPGALVTISDERGNELGSALYSSTSQIALRVVSRVPLDSEEAWLQLLGERVLRAIAFRKRVVRDSNAYRVIFSEGDLLPGVIADRYDDVLTVQVLTQAMDRDSRRDALIRVLQSELQPAAIFERVEPRIRELEALPPLADRVLSGAKTEAQIEMNGIKFIYHAHASQKTGAFLDQRENYAAAARYARGRALDVFCYQGGFALHMARAGCAVTGVDAARPALESADRNTRLNGLEIEWMEANAFEFLKDYASAGEQYDTIVLDPPAFAKSKSALETALRGYKEINLRALKMLKPGGILITSSCSFHVSESSFLDMLQSAAEDARRTVRLLEKRTQAQDHPIVLGMPETYYLKCMICEVL